jgi:hypothetical protein
MPLTRRQLLGASLLSVAAPLSAAPTSRGVALTGSDDTPPSPLLLRAGPLTALFEPHLGFLRYVRYDNREVVRAVYAAVRDKVWGTVPARLSNLVLEQRDDACRLTFDVDCQQDDIDFFWQGIITGSPDGVLRFEMNGRARSTFLKNRLGFAVLHPVAECAGKPCLIETTSGSKQEGKFPDYISPHQPFLDIRAITHTVAEGVTAEVRMEGDTFEMEDHRNWTDGNYKTYCTPLALPYPVELKAGAGVRQSVTITLRGATTARRYRRPDSVELKIDAARRSKLPAFGTVFNGDAVDAELFRLARFAHLRVDLRLWEPGWEQALRDAAQLGLPLEAAVFVSDQAAQQLPLLAAAAKNVRLARWLVFHQKENATRQEWLRLARQTLPPGAPLGGGTNLYFTELNRERPPVAAIDLAAYSINPQVHAFDNLSLVENLEPQADTLATARTFLGGKPVAVTPVTLRPRFNPLPAGPSAAPAPTRIDPRQQSLFGAAWTLGSAKYLSEGGAASVTFYESAGPAGIAQGARAFPLLHVLADLGESAASDVVAVDSSEPLRVVALALERRTARRMLVANLTAEPQIVRLWDGWLGRRVTIRRLDEHSFEEATNRPLDFRRATPDELLFPAGRLELALLPYAVLRLDSVTA